MAPAATRAAVTRPDGHGGDFAGKVAVVTGGSTGIGRAVVELIAAGGGRVVYCTHDAATLDAATLDADAASAGRVIGMVADVRSADAVAAVVDRAVRAFGGLDILVCSAGIQTYGTVEDTTEQDWSLVLDVNLTGMFRAAKCAVPKLRSRGGGAIVLISSIQGRAPQTRVVGYSVSKAGVDALARSMAVDHAADRIRVNAVAPGPVDTPLLRTRDPHAPPATPVPAPPAPGGPAPRLAAPTEIAEVVAFLASDRSSYLTGATVYADGGMSGTPGRVLIS